MMLKRLALMMGVLGLWACGNGDPYQPAPLPPLGEAITATPGTWTWVDFPDSRCDDGSPTGIAINPAASGKDLVVFFNGGGACWERTTCLILNTSSHGPFNRTNFDNMKGKVNGSILDRTLAGSPFANYSMVFVPYCTGDVHAGDKQADYGKPFYHSGYKNAEAFLKRLRPTFPSVDHLVVTGSSGGGFGSAFNYDQFRRYFPDAKRAYLLDDSGPPFIGDAVEADLRTSWYDAWGLSTTVGARCPGCRDDFSGMITALSRRYPEDQLALLSSTRDQVIRTFYLQAEDVFQTNLYALATQVMEPLPNTRYYFVDGNFHTFLGAPTMNNAPGTPLLSWIGQMVSDDPAWKSVKP